MENYHSVDETQVMSIKDWFVTLLIAAIPVVGIIMLFVWGFGGGVNTNKSNWAKAGLILIALIIGMYVVAVFFFGALVFLGGH